MTPSVHRAARSLGPALAGALAGAVAVAGDAAAVPPDPPFEQTVRCVGEVAAVPEVDDGVSAAQRTLGWAGLGSLSTGAGVTVAVIDTGVAPHPLFGDRLVPGGDDLDPEAERPGTEDCDGHGTLVAGIIAGGPDTRTGFTGVAPEARVLTIRQSSSAYVRVTADGRVPVGDEASLAEAVDTAVEAGADVVSISLVRCTTDLADTDPALVEAVRAAVAADVVVVAAAGNVGGDTGCQDQNAEGTPAATVTSPGSIDEVLTVGSVAADGTASDFSLAGEWVDVAAPGEELVSLDPRPDGDGEVAAVRSGDGLVPVSGTSFATPVVSGLAALVRARFPDLSAAQVVARIEATASPPVGAGGRSWAVGHGVVNPRLALTAVIPAEGAAGVPGGSDRADVQAGSMPALAPAPDRSAARLVSGAGTAGLLAALALVLGWRAVRRRPSRER